MSENLPSWLGSPGVASTGFMAQHKKSEMSYRGKKGSCHVLSTLLAKRLCYFALL